MIKTRHGVGTALDRLTQVFSRVQVTGLRVTVFDIEPGSDPTMLATVGYMEKEPKKSYVDIVQPMELSRIKALTEYADALEEIATHKPQFR